MKKLNLSKQADYYNFLKIWFYDIGLKIQNYHNPFTAIKSFRAPSKTKKGKLCLTCLVMKGLNINTCTYVLQTEEIWPFL